MKKLYLTLLTIVCLGGLLVEIGILPKALARSIVTPWTGEMGIQNLVYGSSSPLDVQQALGRPPDEIRRFEQMFPVVENHIYYDEAGSGTATLFVFENNFLVGMHYKSANDQMVDITYFLPNNGDRQLTTPYLGGFYSYYPYFPMYAW
jgi:hypothetical protein